MDGITRSVRGLERGLVALAALCALLMMLHVSADLFSRFVLGKQLQGTIEIVSAYYMVGLVFLPLAYIDRRGAHISADVFTSLMSPKLRALSIIFTEIVILVWMGALVYFSAREALLRTADGEVWRSGESLIPVWYSRWLVPVGSAGMFLSVLLRLCGSERRHSHHR
jgi:TRAP-type C4-dicarboxylate transport system permease small subunit